MNVQDSNHMIFNSVLFGLAMLAFFLLLALEKAKPYRQFSPKVYKESLITNTTAFLINNVILMVLRASSLFLIAQQFSSHGLLSGLDSGPIKWVLAFALFDLAIYAWHVASHRYEWLWRFHKIHHSDKSFNVSTGFRFHVFDLLLEIVYKSIFVIVIGVEAHLIISIEIIELFFVFFITPISVLTKKQWFLKSLLPRLYTAYIILLCAKNTTTITVLCWRSGIGYLVRARN